MPSLEDLVGPTFAAAIAQSVEEACRRIVREELGRVGPAVAPSEALIQRACQDAVRDALAKSAAPDEDIFSKLFQLAPLCGDYVEFGVFRGSTFIRAFRAAREWTERILAGRGDHLVDDPGALRARTTEHWARRRFIGFDSFEGMPEPEGVDRERVIWKKGTFASPYEAFRQNVVDAGVDLSKVVAVPGFFSETLTDRKRAELGIEKIAVAHIDSDLYESARLALAFITPALQNGTVILFDEWFAYRGHPLMGEQRAFAEWRESNPDWLVTEYQSAGVTAKAFIVNHRTRRTPFRDRLAEIIE